MDKTKGQDRFTMKEVDLIIFDLDGTLVDSQKDIINSVNYCLRKLGLKEKKPELIASYIGIGREHLVREAVGSVNKDKFDKAYSIFREHYNKHLVDTTVLYLGIKNVLDYFKNKKKTVITNRGIESSKRVLKLLGVINYFDKIIGGDDEECRKPSPKLIQYALKELGIKNERAIMVGDMIFDIKAAKAAGVATCAVTYGIGKIEDIIRAKPDYIIDHIEELKNIIM